MRSLLFAAVFVVSLVACRDQRGAPLTSGEVYATQEGFVRTTRNPPPPKPGRISLGTGIAAPEAVLHDREADVYLVSSINGAPGIADDNGFISRVSPAGKILDLKWIDGEAADVVLHAPKGMAVDSDTLYVADLEAVRRFDRRSGRPMESWEIPGSKFLNDVAVGEDGSVYVTETAIIMTAQGPVESGVDAVHRFDRAGRRSVVADGPRLHGPNGIVAVPRGVAWAAFSGEEIFLLREGKLSLLARLPEGHLDGLVVLADGSLLVSSWDARGVFHVRPGETPQLVVEHVDYAASIDYDAGRKQILIPLLMDGVLRIEPWDPQEAAHGSDHGHASGH